MTSRSVSLPRAAALSIAISALASSVALAQAPSSPVGGTAQAGPGVVPIWASQLEGKNVRVTADGVRRRGRVTSASPSGLVLIEDDAPTTIPFNQIMRVEKTPHRLRNGTLIGLAAGAGLGMLMAKECGFGEGDGECIVWLPIFAGIGAGAGVGLGAIFNSANKGGDVLYDARRSSRTMTLAPILSPTRKGVAFSMTWR
jgi:hypothetical protein